MELNGQRCPKTRRYSLLRNDDKLRLGSLIFLLYLHNRVYMYVQYVFDDCDEGFFQKIGAGVAITTYSIGRTYTRVHHD